MLYTNVFICLKRQQRLTWRSIALPELQGTLRRDAVDPALGRHARDAQIRRTS